MVSRFLTWVDTRERELAERISASVDESVRRALVNAAGLKLVDVWKDTGNDGSCTDVFFEQRREITSHEMKDAVLAYAGESAVPDTYETYGPTRASIRVWQR